MNRNIWEEMSKCEKRSFQKFVFPLEKPKARWLSYWVLLLRPFRVLNRGGGTFQCILNVRSSFFWPWKNHGLRRLALAGWCESVPWRQGKDVQLGNFKLDTFVGLLMGHSVKARRRKAGRKRWKCAGNAMYSRQRYGSKLEASGPKDSLLPGYLHRQGEHPNTATAGNSFLLSY